jgi:hypothetical protein
METKRWRDRDIERKRNIDRERETKRWRDREI